MTVLAAILQTKQGEDRLSRGRSGSEIIALAELSAALPHRTGDALAVLLAAARPFDDGFLPLRPFWTGEATHRALVMLRLFTTMRRRERWRGGDAEEHRLALRLASALACVGTAHVRRVVPCSGALREVARDLVALFEPSVGDVALETEVASLGLPAYKRRALVLLGHELVANALLHAFAGRAVGRISLRLGRVADGLAHLVVADDGIGFRGKPPCPARSTAGGLSELLEGDLHYRSSDGWGASAEVIFPVR